MKILVARTDHLGDLILTTPLFRALAQAGHEVELLAPQKWLPLMEKNPHLKALWPLEEAAPDFPRNWLGLARWMQSRFSDVLIFPYSRPKELLWAGARSGTRRRIAMWGGWSGRLLGYACLRSGLPEHPRHMAEVWLDPARELGISTHDLQPEIHLAATEQTWAEKILTEKLPPGPVLAIHPGCAGNTCNLPASEYGRLAELILEKTAANLIITGTAEESRLLQSWNPSIVRSPRVWNSLGTLSLREFAAVISRVNVLLCPSTGPLHIASALHIPTVTPFCRRPAIGRTLWENLGSTAARVVEPVGDFCFAPDRAAIRHCDFQGGITADRLLNEIQPLLAGK